jgi:hypothetical protein
MDDFTKQAMITKLGTLMFANAELAAQNQQLLQQIALRDRRIKELDAQVPRPADPGEGAEANGAGVHRPLASP